MAKNVVVRYFDGGRLGNRMFQLALGYVVALQSNCPLQAPAIGAFKETEKFSNTVEIIDPIFTHNYGDNTFDLEAARNHKGTVIVDTYMQNWHYLENYKEELQKLFAFSCSGFIPPTAELVVHIRETDYKTLGVFLGDQAYIEAIKLIQPDITKVLVVTDNPGCDIVAFLRANGARVASDNIVVKHNYIDNWDPHMRDFLTMMSANSLLISQSTFSWWAAFLGDVKNVYAFASDTAGIWKLNPKGDDVDLILPSFKKLQLA